MSNVTVSELNIPELESYIHNVCEILELDQSDSFVDIEFVHSFGDGAAGYCSGDEECIDVEIAYNDQVGELPIDLLKKHIAHELIHAQQIANGRLENVGLTLRNDKVCNVVVWDDVEYINCPYNEQPWEDDAYGREMEVMNEAMR